MRHSVFWTSVALVALATNPALAFKTQKETQKQPDKTTAEDPFTSSLQGNDSSGGGAGVGDELFDFYENQGVEELHPEKLEAYQKYIEPLLKEIQLRTPTLVPVLLSALSQKTWYLEPKKLGKCDEIGSMIQVDAETVACQNKFEGRISKGWFQGSSQSRRSLEPVRTLTRQAAIILHEMVQNLRIKTLRTPAAIDNSSVRQITRVLFTLLSDKPVSADQLQAELVKHGFGLYGTLDQEKAIARLVEQAKPELYKSLCTNAQKEKPKEPLPGTINIGDPWGNASTHATTGSTNTDPFATGTSNPWGWGSDPFSTPGGRVGSMRSKISSEIYKRDSELGDVFTADFPDTIFGADPFGSPSNPSKDAWRFHATGDNWFESAAKKAITGRIPALCRELQASVR